MICFNDLFINFCADLFFVCDVVVAISLLFGASMDYLIRNSERM